jgi:superfamily II DNA/RNA helicase
MVATDLAARGLDFPFLSHVINFDFPQSTSDYLHRAGRAGRAGKKGHIYSLYHNKDEDIINELKEANENKVPVTIKGSSYSKINREVLQERKLAKVNTNKPTHNLNVENEKKGLNLPRHYLDMRKRFRQSESTPGYKPMKAVTGRRALGQKSRGQLARRR